MVLLLCVQQPKELKSGVLQQELSVVSDPIPRLLHPKSRYTPLTEHTFKAKR